MLSIIIPTKDRQEILNKSLEHLAMATRDIEKELIIVNDGNDDLEVDFEKAKILRNTGNGAASARNTGAGAANGDILLFLDDDIILSSDNIHKALKLLDQHSDKAINFSWEYPASTIEELAESLHGRFILRTGRYSNRFRVPELAQKQGLIETEGLSSQFFCIRARHFSEAGGYDNRIPMAGVEDLVLAKNLKKNGIGILLSMDDWVVHNESDRLTLDALLRRFWSGARTVREANKLGYTFIDIGLTSTQKSILTIGSWFRVPIRFCVTLLPNVSYLDKVYGRLAGLLLAINTYRGYFSN